jgi:chitodextrinase
MQAAEQLRKALQMYATTLTDEKAMEVVAVFDSWEAGKVYAVGDFVTYGENGVGDPQLYKCISAHTSQADWTPDKAVSLFDAIGLDDNGYPVWSQPTGAHDAYNTGDIVNYNGTLYKCLIDGNVYAPDAYPAGWEVYVE